MRLSRATTYALYGLSYIAGQPAGRFVPLSEIGSWRSVPEKHLAKIFQQLVRARILVSARGVNGGFALVKPARETSLFEVVEILEGGHDGGGCLLVCSECALADTCAVNRVWRAAEASMIQSLRLATLRDIAEPVSRAATRPTHPASR